MMCHDVYNVCHTVKYSILCSMLFIKIGLQRLFMCTVQTASYIIQHPNGSYVGGSVIMDIQHEKFYCRECVLVAFL